MQRASQNMKACLPVHIDDKDIRKKENKTNTRI